MHICCSEQIEALRVIVDYKWRAFARRRHLENARRALWTLFLQRLLATPTMFNATLDHLPFWEYVVMALIFIFCISPTVEFCGRLIIVEGWRNLLDADSATSFIDIGWTTCICWCGLPTHLPHPGNLTRHHHHPDPLCIYHCRAF